MAPNDWFLSWNEPIDDYAAHAAWAGRMAAQYPESADSYRDQADSDRWMAHMDRPVPD